MIYNGRECVIEAQAGAVENGFYAYRVTIKENGVVIDSHPESVPLSRLRERADANTTSIQDERDAAIADAITRAENRFKDIVDAESL